MLSTGSLMCMSITWILFLHANCMSCMQLTSRTVHMSQLYQINTTTGSFYHQLSVTYVYHLPYKYLTKILSPRDSRKNHPFIPLACAECDDSFPFSGDSSIPLCYIPSPSTLFHQLVFHPPSLHLAIYFLDYAKFIYNIFIYIIHS
jgi:hypothetical protein